MARQLVKVSGNVLQYFLSKVNNILKFRKSKYKRNGYKKFLSDDEQQ